MSSSTVSQPFSVMTSPSLVSEELREAAQKEIDAQLGKLVLQQPPDHLKVESKLMLQAWYLEKAHNTFEKASKESGLSRWKKEGKALVSVANATMCLGSAESMTHELTVHESLDTIRSQLIEIRQSETFCQASEAWRKTQTEKLRRNLERQIAKDDQYLAKNPEARSVVSQSRQSGIAKCMLGLLSSAADTTTAESSPSVAALPEDVA